MKPLVAWNDSAYCKFEGGLDLEDFNSLNLTLKLCWCGHLLTDDVSAWVLLTKESIARCLHVGYRRKTRRTWSTTKMLLLDDKLSVAKSPFIRDLTRGFNKACKSLVFTPMGVPLPTHLTIEQLLLVLLGNSPSP